MDELSYAVVAYLPGRLGRFVDHLRQRVNPAFACWQAHVTLLPPRLLRGTPEESLAKIRQTCGPLEPFEVAVDGWSTFWPVNGVVYLTLGKGSERLVQLHDALNCDGLAQQEVYPYIPHITLAQQLDETGTQKVLAEVASEWTRYDGEVSFRVESLTLVRQMPDNRWADLAPVPLGILLAPSRK